MYNEEFEYDANGNKILINANGKVKKYTYDALNRLQSVTEGTDITEYEYDSFNNISKEHELTSFGIKTKQYYYDENNRLILSSSNDDYEQYSYDNAGNLTKRTTRYSTDYYSYDGYNRLSAYYNGQTNAEYSYNVDGLRKSKTVNGNITRFVYDGANVVGELEKDNYYIYYRATELLGSRSYTGETNYYRIDGHGSVIAVLNTAGEVIKDYSYSAFGEKQALTAVPMGDKTILYQWKAETENVHNPFGYCGEYTDAETGLVYLRNRMYSPEIGRFITEDPIKDGLNWCAYCGNNPVMFVDPLGLITDEEVEMYENGEMSPGAYSYLMWCTYKYCLSDDEIGRNLYSYLADEFRKTNYTTTPFSDWNEIIEYMPQKPTGEIAKEQHHFRNRLNLQFEWDDFVKLNERLPEGYKWRELPLQESGFHKFGQVNNRKYVSACEHFEAVYTKENYLVDENFSAINMGTYNYYDPSQPDMHTKYDIAPYGKWGNTEKGWIWSGAF